MNGTNFEFSASNNQVTFLELSLTDATLHISEETFVKGDKHSPRFGNYADASFEVGSEAEAAFRAILKSEVTSIKSAIALCGGATIQAY